MKKFYLLLLALSFLLISPSNLKANDLAETLKGRILLQVEEHGEAWYVNPDTKKRHFLGRPDDAFNLMRQLGLGISESDYYSFNNYAPQRLSGKILLRVEVSGEAYYVNPVDLRMHFLGRPADAFNVMRTLGLGISNYNLSRILVESSYKKYINQDIGFNLKYPDYLTINNNDYESLSLNISIERINSLNHPLNYNKETAQQDKISLAQGNYGIGPDWPLELSKKVRNIGPVNAQEFMVLSRFDVCSVVLERRLVFYYNDHQVVIILSGNKNNIISENPSYFIFDNNNCGDQKIWEHEKKEQFYNNLLNNSLKDETQKWFNLFDQIINTINFQ